MSPGRAASGSSAGRARRAAGVRIAAHRGGAPLRPENSLGAFRDALALGVDLLEADIHLTADGEPVVLHDPTLERTTTGVGPVADARLADLGRVRLRTPDGPTDEPVPTLADLLALLAPASAGLLLEIKVGSKGRRYRDIEAKALACVRARSVMARTTIMAFEPDTLSRVRELTPGIATILLVGRRQTVSPVAAPALARAFGAGGLGIDYRLLDAAVIASARQAGVSVAAWTVNEEAAMRRLIDLGVDTIITDRPDVALALLRRRG